jgi:hypothetical protein
VLSDKFNSLFLVSNTLRSDLSSVYYVLLLLAVWYPVNTWEYRTLSLLFIQTVNLLCCPILNITTMVKNQ